MITPRYLCIFIFTFTSFEIWITLSSCYPLYTTCDYALSRENNRFKNPQKVYQTMNSFFYAINRIVVKITIVQHPTLMNFIHCFDFVDVNLIRLEFFHDLTVLEWYSVGIHIVYERINWIRPSRKCCMEASFCYKELFLDRIILRSGGRG